MLIPILSHFWYEFQIGLNPAQTKPREYFRNFLMSLQDSLVSLSMGRTLEVEHIHGGVDLCDADLLSRVFRA